MHHVDSLILAESIVANLQQIRVVHLVDEDVLRFEITMRDAVCVQERDALRKLCGEVHYYFMSMGDVQVDLIQETAVLAELHYDEVLVRAFDDFDDVYDVIIT